MPLEVGLRAGAVRMMKLLWRHVIRWLKQGPPCPRCGYGRCDYEPAEHPAVPSCRLFEWFMGVR